MSLGFPKLRVRQNLWGGQSCPQPPFRRLLQPRAGLRSRRDRLKAGCSQDWLPHELCRIAVASNEVAMGRSECARSGRDAAPS